MSEPFDYQEAFSRNVGWVTRQEQATLAAKRVAIAGLGGVGGSHLITLARLGIGGFHLADFDRFELANFNRQAGATVSTLGREKTEVLTAMARDINPTAMIRTFSQGVTEGNVHEFLSGIDLYVDGLDFFAVAARRRVFAACAELGIPAVTAAPLGMGVALLNFLPGHMSFEQYFQLEGQTEEEQLLRFLLGLSPAMLQGGYLVDPSVVDLAAHRGPSTPMACELCAGVAATQALKILLGRGPVWAAPMGMHFDAYRNRLVRTWRPGGNRNLLQRLGLTVARRRFGRAYRRETAHGKDEQPSNYGRTGRILERARWAPSGDNTQPWRFEITEPDHLVVHGFDTRDHCVYDLEGHASQLALGTLLENIAIAASGEGLHTEIRRRPGLPDTTPTFDIRFTAGSTPIADPLLHYIPLRAVQRRRMRTRPLTQEEKSRLEASLRPRYRVLWLEGFAQRLRTARLTFANGGLRLNLPEAYPTHRDVIEWGARYSEDRIPDQAIGADPVNLRLMRWALKRWSRVAFLNRYLGGTLVPRLQLDLLPGIACGAHFVILDDAPPATVDDYVAAGRSVQRFWLTATELGLYLQPEMTPLIFHQYLANGVDFTESKAMQRRARRVSGQLRALLGEQASGQAVFMGRIGAGPAPMSRSTRLPLERLMYLPGSADQNR